MKRIEWLGSSRSDVRKFPDGARLEAGWQLELVQRGDDPDDWKPMKTVGAGVREIRIRESTGAFRIIYLAALEDRALVIHAFQKKTQTTSNTIWKPRRSVLRNGRHNNDIRDLRQRLGRPCGH